MCFYFLHARSYNFFVFVFKDFVYLFLERGDGREKERERNISRLLTLVRPLLGTWPATQACALTGNRTSDPLVSSLALNPLNYTSQGEKTSLNVALFRHSSLMKHTCVLLHICVCLHAHIYSLDFT